MKIALCQRNSLIGNTKENIGAICSTIESRKEEDIDLFCFPELFREGYNCTKDQFIQLADDKNGSDSIQVREIAKKYGVCIAYGYAEKGENGEIYNSSQLINSNGELLINYRKTHLYDPKLQHERTIFTPGDEFSPIVEIKGIKCALLICWDVELPEICRILAIRGTECFIVLTANFSKLTNIITIRSRAIENNAFVIYNNFPCSNSPNNFCGLSAAYGPNGDCIVMATETGEDICVAEIDKNLQQYKDFIQINPLVHDRRPELYNDLVKN